MRDRSDFSLFTPLTATLLLPGWLLACRAAFGYLDGAARQTSWQSVEVHTSRQLQRWLRHQVGNRDVASASVTSAVAVIAATIPTMRALENFPCMARSLCLASAAALIHKAVIFVATSTVDRSTVSLVHIYGAGGRLPSAHSM